MEKIGRDKQSSEAPASTASHPGTEDRPLLSQRLQEASRKEHRLSDSLVAARLVITATHKRQWAEALTCFWYIISALERAIDSSKAQIVGGEALLIFYPRVRRTAAFENDLQAFYGPAWQQKLSRPSPAVQLYLERISLIEGSKPYLLLAHAYTQHMALLAGGRILRRSVRSSMQLGPDDPGTAIFEFQEDAKALRKEYKGLVDALDSKMSASEIQELIAEHRLVFQLNNDIIRSFPVTPSRALTGVIKLLPPEILLLLVSVTIALVLMLYTRRWISFDPDASEFEDPDAIIA